MGPWWPKARAVFKGIASHPRENNKAEYSAGPYFLKSSCGQNILLGVWLESPCKKLLYRDRVYDTCPPLQISGRCMVWGSPSLQVFLRLPCE